MSVSEFLQQHGPAWEADMIEPHGPCGPVMRVEAQLTTLVSQGLARRRGDRKWEIVGAKKSSGGTARPARNGKPGQALALSGAAALVVKPQRAPVLHAEPVPAVAPDADDLDAALARLKAEVARTISNHIEALVGNPADLGMLSTMLKALARRAG